MVLRTGRRFLLAAAIGLLLAGESHAAEEFSEALSSKTIEYTGQRILIINERGLTKLRPSRSSLIEILGTKVAEAGSESEAVQAFAGLSLDVQEDPMGKTLTIRVSEEGFGPKRSLVQFMGRLKAPHMNLDIDVPDGCEIELNSGAGMFDVLETDARLRVTGSSCDGEISHSRGDVRVDVTSGNIRCEGVRGAVTVSTTSGDVELSGVEGDVEVSVTTGEAVCNNVDGTLVVRNVSGNSSVSAGDGSAKVESGTGDVEVVSRDGSVQIDAGGGGVTFWVDPMAGRTYEAKTTGGDIEFKLPRDSSALLSVWTTSGEIYAKVPMKILAISRTNLEGRIGEGGAEATVTLKTVHGDIRVLPLR